MRPATDRGRASSATATSPPTETETPALNFTLPSTVGSGDFITATATDAIGNTSEFSPCLQVAPLRITSLTRLANGNIRLQGDGVPNQLHTMEASDNLTPNSFGALSSPVAADANGFWSFDDTTTPLPARRFYRLRFP
jgi:hypothetical protein